MNEQYEYHDETPRQAAETEPGYTYPPVAPEHKPRYQKKRSAKGLIAVALCCSLLGGILGGGGVLLWNNIRESKATEGAADPSVAYMLEGRRESSVIQTVSMDTSKQLTPAEVYAANVNSTVGITTSITTNFWGYQTTSAASGSGFLITDDGYILTNYHVIEDSSSISVSLYDGSVYDAALIGYDESNDIAVLKIDAKDLVPVVLGDSDNLNVGDTVAAIGNPLGELTFSLTVGTVSAKDREVTLSSNVTMDLLQTDCAINSGNSGGALFNLYGEVIGITNAKYSSSSSSEASIDNIGFAIPVNSIRGIVESIIEKGYISKPYMGVSVLDVGTEAQAYGIPAGAAIQAVAADGPAEQAGLQTGDVITQVNGTTISGSSDLVQIVGNSSVGDELVLTVYRRGENLEFTVVIAEQIQSALANEETQQSSYPSQFPGGFYGRR